MSSTNKTSGLQLSQFIATDKPSWLGDYNSDMSKIDVGYTAIKAEAEGASGSATDAKNIANEAKVSATNAKASATDAKNIASEAKTSATDAINQVTTLTTNIDSYTRHLLQNPNVTKFKTYDLTIIRNPTTHIYNVIGVISLNPGQTISTEEVIAIVGDDFFPLTRADFSVFFSGEVHNSTANFIGSGKLIFRVDNKTISFVTNLIPTTKLSDVNFILVNATFINP